MMGEHTPGPWTGLENAQVHVHPGHFWYCGSLAYANRQHDARLMAAAPELLGALLRMVAMCGDYEFARIAIAKAQGG